MAKQIDYPRASLRAAVQLAETVDGFAGSCSVELAAEKLGKKVSGAFAALVGAAVKYGLLQSKGGKLTTTPLFREVKLAYTPQDATMQLRRAFLMPPLFRAVYDKFRSQRLPVEHFEKVLIREFSVPDAYAFRICRYFIDGAKQCNLLGPDNLLVNVDERVPQQPSNDQALSGAEDDAELGSNYELVESINVPALENRVAENVEQYKTFAVQDGATDEFRLNIRGPGVDFSLEIRELEDLELVQVMMRKIEKALKGRGAAT
jgi:hypothetical protein